MARSKTLAVLLALASLALQSACGSSSSGGGDDGAVADNGGGDVAGDGLSGDGIDKDPAGPDGEQPFTPVKVDTTVAPASIVAGGTTTVSCTAEDAAGQKQDVTATYTVNPAAGTTKDGATLTATKAGSLAVACTYQDLTDDTPATLQVAPATAAKVTTTLGASEIPAGGSTTVACAVEDQFGNSVTGLTTSIVVPPEVTAGAAGVTSTVAGDWEIACAVPSVPDLEKVPATLTVTPLAPVEAELYLSPERACYTIGTKVTLKARGLDQYGNVTGDLALVDESATPVEGLEANGDHKYTFLAEGPFSFSGTVNGEQAFTDSIDVICDGTGPALNVVFPERGQTFDTSAMLVAGGTIVDGISGVKSFTLNDAPVPVAPDGTWSLPLQPAHGQNYLLFQAQDQCNNKSKTMRAFHYSSGYTNMETQFPEDSMVHDGLVVFLDDKLFYDADPTNTATLSAIAETILGNLDLGAFLPNPTAEFALWPCDAYGLNISNITYDDVSIMINPVDGGLHLNLAITTFAADFELTGNGGVCLLAGTAGTFKADKITLLTTILISLDANKMPLVEMAQPTVDITNLTVEGSSIGGQLLAALINPLKTLLTGIVQGVVEDMLQSQITGLLQDGLSMLVMDQPIAVDLPIGEGIPLELRLLTAYDALQFSADGGLLSVAGTIRSEKKIARTVLGAIRREGCLGTEPGGAYAPDMDAPVEAAIFDDLLNQAAYSAWANGVLTLTISEADFAAMNLDLSQYGIKNMAVATDAYIPPVIDGCQVGDDGKPRRLVQLGDVFVHATFEMTNKPVDISMYLYAQTSLGFETKIDEETGGQKLGILIAPFDLFTAEIVALNDEWKGKESVFENLIGGILKQVLEDQLAGADLSFAIPSFALGSLAEGLPADQGLAIDLKSLDYGKGYTIVKAAPQIVAIDPNNPPAGLGCGVGGRAVPAAWLLSLAALLGLALARRRA